MENKEELIETNVQLHYRYLYMFFGVFILIIIFIYFFVNYSGVNQITQAITSIGLFALWVGVCIYLIKPLTKKICFLFGENLTIQILDAKNNTVIEEHIYDYNDIKSCLLSSGSPRTATIKLYSLNNNNLRLVLYSGENYVEQEDRIALKIFYNLHAKNPDIVPARPLFLKSLGVIWIIGMLILVLINILFRIHDSSDSKSLILTLPTSIGLIFIVIGTRIKQKKIYDEMLSVSTPVKE